MTEFHFRNVNFILEFFLHAQYSGWCLILPLILSYRRVWSLSAICRMSPMSLLLIWNQCASLTIYGISFCTAVGLNRTRPLQKWPTPRRTRTLRLPICPSTAVRRSLHPLLCSHTHWITAYLSSSMESHTLPRRRPPRPHSLSWRLKKMQKGREGMTSKGHLKDEGELIAVSSMAARKCTPRARTWKHINAHTPVSSFCVGVYSPTCIFIYSCHNSVLSFGKQNFSHLNRVKSRFNNLPYKAYFLKPLLKSSKKS